MLLRHFPLTMQFPGVSFFLTQWYRRYEINLRIALFFSAATAAGAFGGLLARLINFMDGVGGLQGWVSQDCQSHVWEWAI